MLESEDFQILKTFDGYFILPLGKVFPYFTAPRAIVFQQLVL